MSSFYKLQIKAIKRETSNAISVVFSVPDELKSVFGFVAGQYLNIKLTLDGTEIRRAYSICSSPQSGDLAIAIKAVKNGLFSKFANENLNVGDFLDVSPPEGRFTFEPNPEKQKNYAAFIAGSGITPAMSILQSVLENEPKSTFVLVYGNKTPEETIFYEQLHDLQQQHVGRFFVHNVYSQAKVENQFFGRIDKSIVTTVLQNKHKEKEFDKFYLCGPEDMINLVTSVLKEHNVSEKNIKFELFSTSSKSDDGAAADANAGHSNVTVIVDGDTNTFEMSQKQTILEAALKNGLDVPYSCQGGICSSCLGRVTTGTAVMRKNSILTDSEISEGLVLTCQAHPTSSTIVVDYDDV